MSIRKINWRNSPELRIGEVRSRKEGRVGTYFGNSEVPSYGGICIVVWPGKWYIVSGPCVRTSLGTMATAGVFSLI